MVLVLAAIGFAACEPSPPPEPAAPPPAESAALPAGETLSDVVRETLADILKDEDPYSRARRLGALLPTLGPELVPAVVQTLESRLLDFGATEFDLLLRYWATHEPEQASVWARTKAPLEYQPVAVYAALRVWAEADPQAASAFTWMWTVQSPGLERVVPLALVRGWYARGDPPDLRQWMRGLPPGILRQRATASYIQVLMETQGSGAVQRWAETLPDGRDFDDDATYKLEVFSRATSALSALDVEAAKRWCEAHCDGPHGRDMRRLIATRWVHDDGPAALAWLLTSPPGYDRDFGLQMAFAEWGQVDREAALAWMAAHRDGESGDLEPPLRPLYENYARLLALDAPAEAIRWAERVEKEAVRNFLLIMIARGWRDLDESAAEEWLLQSPLSEEQRAQARVPLKRRFGPRSPEAQPSG